MTKKKHDRTKADNKMSLLTNEFSLEHNNVKESNKEDTLMVLYD